MTRFSFVLAAILLLAGCSNEKKESAAPKEQTTLSNAEPQTAPTIQTVKLDELLDNPKSFEGKDVAVSGVFNSICCADDFVLKDGLNAIEIYVTEQCPMPSKEKLRSKMQVRGTVKVKGDDVTVVAKEIKFQ